MSETKISRLLSNRVSKWTKQDFAYAAKILAEELERPNRLTGIIHRAICGIPQVDELILIRRKLADPSISESNLIPKKSGRPAIYTLEESKKMLEIVERRRLTLANKRKVSPKAVTDFNVALNFAENLLKKRREPWSNRHKMAKAYEKYIKALKSKVKRNK